MTGFEKAYEPCEHHRGAAVLTIDVPVGQLRYAGRICHGCAEGLGVSLATALIDLLGHATVAPDIAPALEQDLRQEREGGLIEGELKIAGKDMSVSVPVAGRDGLLSIIVGIGHEHEARRRADALIRDALGDRHA